MTPRQVILVDQYRKQEKRKLDLEQDELGREERHAEQRRADDFCMERYYTSKIEPQLHLDYAAEIALPAHKQADLSGALLMDGTESFTTTDGVQAVYIESRMHKAAEFAGVFRLAGTHAGLPRFVKRHVEMCNTKPLVKSCEYHLYYHPPSKAWVLKDKFTPQQRGCKARIRLVRLGVSGKIR